MALSGLLGWDSSGNRRAMVNLPSSPGPGDAYGFVWDAVNSKWVFGLVQAQPPLDVFIPGWQEFNILEIGNMLTTSVTVHAAANFGYQNTTIAGVAFDTATATTGTANLPNNATGWSGTNWKITRADYAPTPPTIGNNTTRYSGTPDPDLLDPSFGKIPGVVDLAVGNVFRNFYIEFSNLTPGKDYYACLVFAAYAGEKTATLLENTQNTSDSMTFGVSASSITAASIKRYGFTAAGTTIGIIKEGYDAIGSQCMGAFCLEKI